MPVVLIENECVLRMGRSRVWVFMSQDFISVRRKRLCFEIREFLIR